MATYTAYINDGLVYDEETAEEVFADILDSITPNVTIAGIEFTASAILKNCDSTAYDMELSKFLSDYESREFDNYYDYRDFVNGE